MNMQSGKGTGTPLDIDYALLDCYQRERGQIYINGTQTLVRLMLMQAAIDRSNGLRSAGLVTGYRGSPLGSVDQEMSRASQFLDDAHIRFQPAVNEDLAATMIYGSQQVESDLHRSYDGVFGMWYGKGPGVDRSLDALRHGHFYGSSPKGGVLIVAGDDHGCVSSTISHQSDFNFMSLMMPLVHPANLNEYLQFGLYGIALSRFCGVWSGFKAVSEIIEGAQTITVPEPPEFIYPDFLFREGGIHYRWPDILSIDIEIRAAEKLAAAQEFGYANSIDKDILSAKNPRLGIITTGKAHGDVLEAFNVLGIDQKQAEALGISILKIGQVYPLVARRVLEFCKGLDEVLVVEEKREFVEMQVKSILMGNADMPQKVYGKTFLDGSPLLPDVDLLTPGKVADVLNTQFERLFTDYAPPQSGNRLAPELGQHLSKTRRIPYFCSGCPHNRSTKVPDGTRAQSGIGCHYMATWMDRDTGGTTHMGGEGANWVGRAPFLNDDAHVFQNLGDGTYYHSGLLAIRQAVAQNTPITYKILYNDAVAMTGGQAVDGPLNVPDLAYQLHGEGIKHIAIVSATPHAYRQADLPSNVKVYPRDRMMPVQEHYSKIKAPSVIIYEQVCAAELRRRRRQKKIEDPMKRVFIHPDICEGCNDCSVQSNCVSIHPLKTALGTKRHIDQSACNKDFTCVEGFCPSFITVEGADLKKKYAKTDLSRLTDITACAAQLPDPAMTEVDELYQIVIGGVGGTGVITIGALLAMAAHLEGKGASILNFMGLAQKGGSVVNHIKIAKSLDDLENVRISAKRADVLIGCDAIVATSDEVLSRLSIGMTGVVVNTATKPTSGFVLTGQEDLSLQARFNLLRETTGELPYAQYNASKAVEKLLGDGVYANMMLLGSAWQKGLIPISEDAIVQAITLNGVALDMNLAAFRAGRLAAEGELDHLIADDHDLFADDHDLIADDHEMPMESEDFEVLLERLVCHITAYQNESLAASYVEFIEVVRQGEMSKLGEMKGMTSAVARSLHHLITYKDEYEVARLIIETSYLDTVKAQFGEGAKVKFHLAPPLLSAFKTPNGRPRKFAFGRWILPFFKGLSKMKRLRGTALDPFGYLPERQKERALIPQYKTIVRQLLEGLSGETYEASLEIAASPMMIKGYGPVKEKAMEAYQKKIADYSL